MASYEANAASCQQTRLNGLCLRERRPSESVKMSKVRMMRNFVNQRLSAAAEEILELFERTMAEYEEEILRSREEKEKQQKLLDSVLNPQVQLHRPDVHQLMVKEEEVLAEQQERSSSQSQETSTEPAHIKVEQEEEWSSQETEQLQESQEADISTFMITSVPMKSEEDEEKPLSFRLHENQREEKRDTEHLKTETNKRDNPHSHLQPALHISVCDTDDSADWDEGEEPQEGSNPPQNKNRAVSVTRRNAGAASVSLSKCAAGVGQKKQLQEHKILQKELKLFGCSVCGKRYPSLKNLKIHLQRHSVEKPFNCSFCEKCFITKTEMVIHMRVHTGEKPFSCSICGKRFIISGDLKRHSFVHTGTKPFSCSACGKGFTRLEYVKRHKCVGGSSVN